MFVKLFIISCVLKVSRSQDANTTAATGCPAGTWGSDCLLKDSCFYNGRFDLYLGAIAVSENNKKCFAWGPGTGGRGNHGEKEDQFADKKFPEPTACRAPEVRLEKWQKRPWCYIDEGHKNEYCNVEDCPCPTDRWGDNCVHTCSCQNGETCHSSTGCGTGNTASAVNNVSVRVLAGLGLIVMAYIFAQ